MKGRKTKKATKNASKNASHQGSYQQSYDRGSVDHSSATGSGLHEDEYIGHEYDDEPESLNASEPVSPIDFKPPFPPSNDPKLAAMSGNAVDPADAATSRPA